MKFEENNPLTKLINEGNGKAPLNVEAALVWSEWLLERLRGDAGKIDRSGEGEIVWASQKTLAKRYDMSRSSISRYLSEAIERRAVRFIRPHDGDREGLIRYNIQDMDAFMAGVRKEQK